MKLTIIFDLQNILRRPTDPGVHEGEFLGAGVEMSSKQ
jgi:hypothetical protein